MRATQQGIGIFSFVLIASSRASAFTLVRRPAWYRATTVKVASSFGLGRTAVMPLIATSRYLNYNSLAMSDVGDTSPISGNVLVISGNRGLGLEVVRHLKDRKANVVATCRSSNEDLEATGATVIESMDVTEEDAGERLVEAVREKLGKGGTLDYVICVAGILTPDTFEKPDYKGAIKMYEVCVLGPMRAIQSLTISGLVRDGSKIGMVTSEGGSIGLRTDEEGGNNYGHHMSKAAQNMLGKILSLDLKPKGIAICNLHPGFMKTSMTEIYKDKYDEFGAIEAKDAAPGIVKAVTDLTMDKTGTFIAPQGAKSLGLGKLALEDPDSLTPFSTLPW